MLFQVAVDAVIAGVELAADKPLPERRMTGIERGVPIVVPVQELRILVEALGKMLLAEFFDDGGIGEISLGDEFFGKIKILFLLPMHRDFRFCYALCAPPFLFR